MSIPREEAFLQPPEAEITVFSELRVSDPLGPNALALMETRGGEVTYYNNWMAMTHVAYWNSSPADVNTTGEKVSDYLTQMNKRLRYNPGSSFLEQGGPFNGLRVETWNSQRAAATPDAADWGIDRYAGLTRDKICKVNSNYAGSGGVYSHEFGHNYQQVSGMDGGRNNTISKLLQGEYRRLRGADFTARTPEFERFAEDFKYFFGSDDVALVDNPQDDAKFPNDPKVGKQVRWPRQVTGLQALIRGAWPVYNWLKDKDIVQLHYYETDNCYRWERKTSWVTSQWEALLNGVFYRWDGQKWVVYT